MKWLRIADKILNVAKFVPGPHTPFIGVADLVVNAAEAQFGEGQGPKKKEWSEQLSVEIWDLFHSKGIELPIPRGSLGELIEELVTIKNATGEFGHGADAPQFKPKDTSRRVAWPAEFRGVVEFTGPSPME
jgi:hypothetical protein